MPFVIHNEDGTQLMAVDITNKWLNIGPNVPAFNADPNIGLYVIKNQDSYSGMNVCNYYDGEYSSCDIVAISSEQTDLYTGYIDFGMNGASNADPYFAVFDPGCGYLWTASTNLYIGTQDAAETGEADIYFFTGGTGSKDNIRMTITADNKFGFFGAAAVAKPEVTGSAGANAALISLLSALSDLGLITDSHE